MNTEIWGGASVAAVGEADGGGDVDLFESLISKAIRARCWEVSVCDRRSTTWLPLGFHTTD